MSLLSFGVLQRRFYGAYLPGEFVPGSSAPVGGHAHNVSRNLIRQTDIQTRTQQDRTRHSATPSSEPSNRRYKHKARRSAY